MKELPENLKENDFYLARNGNFGWFNLIVRVIGENPFLSLEAWDISANSLHKIHHFDIKEWGAKISHSELLTPLTKSQKPL